MHLFSLFLLGRRRIGEGEEEPECWTPFSPSPYHSHLSARHHITHIEEDNRLAVGHHGNDILYWHQLRHGVVIVRHRSKNAWHLPLQLNCIVVFSDDQYGGRLAIHVPFPTFAEADKIWRPESNGTEEREQERIIWNRHHGHHRILAFWGQCIILLSVILR